MRTLIVLLALALAACNTTEADRGAADARKAIQDGHPHFLFFGLPAFDTGWLDEETGLPAFTQGCVVSEAGGRYQDAFNDEIERALDAGELDRFVLRHKVTTPDALIAGFAGGAGTLLVSGGEPILSPGGSYEIMIRPRGEDDDTLEVHSRDVLTRERRNLMFLGGDRARVLFDHDGTTLLMADDTYERVMTFDLPSGLFMQGFPNR